WPFGPGGCSCALLPVPEEDPIGAEDGTGTDHQPGPAQGEPEVPGDLLPVLRLLGGHLTTTAETTAVDGKAPRPCLRDAHDEGEHEQAADERRDPGEEADDDECPDGDLEHGQAVADVLGHLEGHDVVGLDGPGRAEGLVDLQGTGDDQRPAENQPGEQ